MAEDEGAGVEGFAFEGGFVAGDEEPVMDFAADGLDGAERG